MWVHVGYLGGESGGREKPQGKLLDDSCLPKMRAVEMAVSDAQRCLLLFQALKKKKKLSLFSLFHFPSQFCSLLLNRCRGANSC